MVNIVQGVYNKGDLFNDASFYCRACMGVLGALKGHKNVKYDHMVCLGTRVHPIASPGPTIERQGKIKTGW